jgi:hypothetical protein
MSKGETAMPDKYAGILERLEAAQEGSREMDLAIWRAVGEGAPDRVQWDIENYYLRGIAPHYTTSLDAALQLVPEEVYRRLFIETSHPAKAGFIETHDEIKGPSGLYFEAATPALAVCVAALKAKNAIATVRARQATEDREGE